MIRSPNGEGRLIITIGSLRPAALKGSSAMRCLVCAAEMYLTHVVEDDTMPVPGFEHHTLECLECGNIERRLVFTREKTQPISPSYRRKKERLVKPRTPMETFERVRRRDAALAARRAGGAKGATAGGMVKNER